MQRRKFFKNSASAALGMGILAPQIACSNNQKVGADAQEDFKKAKNIIFMVSDGMSSGTLNMADLLMQRKFGTGSHWLNLYRESKITRALMDTASLDSLVTDSAAASSAWGGGVRVPNGRVNVGPNGEEYKPILQKFKDAGKAVGCVTSVPITHATPAGFCVNSKSRGSQEEIAEKYLGLRFDVMLGGGLEYFSGDLRKDGKDLFKEFSDNAFSVAKTKNELQSLGEGSNPVMGVFYENGIPYALDHAQDESLVEKVPSLAEMADFAIKKLSSSPEGFVLQIEGGKVDWAAHANDTGAILYDQIAFDEAVKVAIDFAAADGETLVVITTDHGNANPGLFADKKTNENFDRIQSFKQTNEWILKDFGQNTTAAQIKEKIEYAQGYAISNDEADFLKKQLGDVDASGLYNPYKLPFKQLAEIQSNYTSVSWAGTNHSSDFVELAMYGPGAELLKPFVKNTELHNFMLKVTEISI